MLACGRKEPPPSIHEFNRFRDIARSAVRQALPGLPDQMIVKSTGHRTLTASARYAHARIEEKRAVIAKVFG